MIAGFIRAQHYRIVLALLGATQPSAVAEPGENSASEYEDSSTTASELLVRESGKDPSVFRQGGVTCVASLHFDRTFFMKFYFFDENNSGPPRIAKVSDTGALGKIEECGPDAHTFAIISLTTCQSPAELERLLSDETWLSYRPPGIPPDLETDGVTRSYGFFALGTDIGCARVVTSRDGRVRVWIPKLERIFDFDDENPEAHAENVIKRGTSYIQWMNARGAVRVKEMSNSKPDLHLDTVVDALEPLPVGRQFYLVLGLRSYLNTFVGGLPRRYAWVLDISGNAPRLVPAAFSFNGQRRDLLLIEASKLPLTDKFRHNVLARWYMKYDPGSRAITVAAFPNDFFSEDDSPPQVGASVARWERDGCFHVTNSHWGAWQLTREWARPRPSEK